MCVSLTRSQPVPTNPGNTTSAFKTTLCLTSPTQIEVTAYGPLAARGSANTVSATTWVYPGKDLTAGNGILLEMPGLICQVINPPTHTVYNTGQTPSGALIIANVAMACGCPISDKKAGQICPGDSGSQPWLQGNFEVSAVISSGSGNSTSVPLTWDSVTGVPGRFTATLPSFTAGTYQMAVCAQQKSTGNTGVELSTFMVKPSSSGLDNSLTFIM
ncbi:hypothetical protein QBC46DRAFT_390693 [Diplogelasinospora grovesii]|uniref:Uncharacterized protein n=1 Tax=Diplogelasinospora grovesii TaxID=303347 RepID=A0AAN6N381_9PEZI|nr:hypothetical protein QBC46DRAFT_390693 [Diplogelasinospora grovesii]